MSKSEKSLKSMAVSAVKMASAALKKFRSERSILKDKIAEITQKSEASTKEARLRDLAMKLVLDEQTINSIDSKVASLRDKDLDVVEAAVELNLQKKMASIGDIDEDGSEDKPKSADAMFLDVLTGK